jgi:CDP-4-dehydro-6-deoxyglucose reductase, E3
LNTIKTISGKKFEQIEGKSILDSAADAGINFQYSCKTGRCSSCKCKLISGTTKSLSDEMGLTEFEKQEGYILSCVRYAEDNIQIEINDLGDINLPKSKTVPCKINRLKMLSDDVMQVFLRIPPTIDFSFIPGQYINLISPNGFRRSYSIANNFQNSLIELHIKRVANGEFSNYLFDNAKVEDLLRLSGPHGTFFLRESKKGIILLATGTGIAPIKSILDNLDELKKSKKLPIFLIWGGRTSNDLYLDFLKVYKNLNIQYIPVLSRPDNDWFGMKGYVQNILIEQNLDLSEYNVYACGLDKMISNAQELLEANGLNQHSFFSDAFVSSSDIMSG